MIFGNRTNMLLIGLAFLLKWAADITVSVVAWKWHLEATGNKEDAVRSLPLISIVSESWFFSWFRQVAVLGSYGMLFTKSGHWKQRRWNHLITTPSSVASVVK
jgi:hypothetical protein